MGKILVAGKRFNLGIRGPGETRSGGTGGPHPGVDIFPDLSLRAKPYCGVKCSQGLHFPATPFIWKPVSSFTSPEPNDEMRPSRV